VIVTHLTKSFTQGKLNMNFHSHLHLRITLVSFPFLVLDEFH